MPVVYSFSVRDGDKNNHKMIKEIKASTKSKGVSFSHVILNALANYVDHKAKAND